MLHYPRLSQFHPPSHSNGSDEDTRTFSQFNSPCSYYTRIESTPATVPAPTLLNRSRSVPYHSSNDYLDLYASLLHNQHPHHIDTDIYAHTGEKNRTHTVNRTLPKPTCILQALLPDTLNPSKSLYIDTDADESSDHVSPPPPPKPSKRPVFTFSTSERHAIDSVLTQDHAYTFDTEQEADGSSSVDHDMDTEADVNDGDVTPHIELVKACDLNCQDRYQYEYEYAYDDADMDMDRFSVSLSSEFSSPAPRLSSAASDSSSGSDQKDIGMDYSTHTGIKRLRIDVDSCWESDQPVPEPLFTRDRRGRVFNFQ